MRIIEVLVLLALLPVLISEIKELAMNEQPCGPLGGVGAGKNWKSRSDRMNRLKPPLSAALLAFATLTAIKRIMVALVGEER